MTAIVFRVVESYVACSRRTVGWPVDDSSLWLPFCLVCASRRSALTHEFTGDWSLLRTELSEKFLLFYYCINIFFCITQLFHF